MKKIDGQERKPEQNKQHKDKRAPKPDSSDDSGDVDCQFEIFVHQQYQAQSQHDLHQERMRRFQEGDQAGETKHQLENSNRSLTRLQPNQIEINWSLQKSRLGQREWNQQKKISNFSLFLWLAKSSFCFFFLYLFTFCHRFFKLALGPFASQSFFSQHQTRRAQVYLMRQRQVTLRIAFIMFHLQFLGKFGKIISPTAMAGFAFAQISIIVGQAFL